MRERRFGVVLASSSILEKKSKAGRRNTSDRPRCVAAGGGDGERASDDVFKPAVRDSGLYKRDLREYGDLRG